MSAADCLFCKIIQGVIPCKQIYQDAQIIAFADKFPKAQTHILVVPREHIASLSAVEAAHAPLLAHLTLKIKEIAHLVGLHRGFRTIVNTGEDGGQEIMHLHYHLLANGNGRLPGF